MWLPPAASATASDGGRGRKVNVAPGPATELPDGLMTVMPAVATPGGVVVVISVSLSMVKAMRRVPTRTSPAALNPLPVMTMVVPPDSGPWLGVTRVTVGTGGGGGGAVTVNEALGLAGDVPPGVVTETGTVPAA